MAMIRATDEQARTAARNMRGKIKVVDDATEVINVMATDQMTATVTIGYRNWVFNVAPTPWRPAAELQKLYLKILNVLEQLEGMDDVTEAATLHEITNKRPEDLLNDLLGCFEASLLIMRNLVVPSWKTPWDRLTWRWRDNPFTNASEREMTQLLGFFLGCRMRSGYHGTIDTREAAASGRLTPQMT